MRFARRFHSRPYRSRWLHLSRLAEAPRVTADPSDGSRLLLRGVVCGVCASRTRSALAGVPGIEAVTVDLEQSIAQVRYEPGTRVSEASLQHALEGAVVGMSGRRLVERAASQLRRLARGSDPTPRKGIR